MAETVIFAEQTLEFSDDSSGFYIAQNKEPFVLESGKTYRVIWDGQEFTLNSFNFKMEGFDGIGIGNEAFFTGVSTELTEPFSVYYLTSSGYSAIVTTDNSASHTVAIYLVEESLSVVVKDRTGADVEYSGVAGIRVRTTDGGTKKFLDSDTMQPLEVTENGTYTVEGNLCGYSPVTVKVPDPVLQEKTITENGEHTADTGFDGLSKVIVEVAGSGGGTLVGKTGVVTGTGSTITIEHNLGVIPLCIFLYPSTFHSTVGSTRTAFGLSKAAATAIGKESGLVYYEYYNEYQSKFVGSGGSYYIEGTGGAIHSANETTFKVGALIYNLQSGSTYTWLAIGLKAE